MAQLYSNTRAANSVSLRARRRSSDIGLYDTTLLQTDYYGLFRSRKYSGVRPYRICESN
ncbi:LPS assembly protein LptD [Vibrio lentus]|nr:LPS assembly protein LptD [Vibrio lentus]